MITACRCHASRGWEQRLFSILVVSAGFGAFNPFKGKPRWNICQGETLLVWFYRCLWRHRMRRLFLISWRFYALHNSCVFAGTLAWASTQVSLNSLKIFKVESNLPCFTSRKQKSYNLNNEPAISACKKLRESISSTRTSQVLFLSLRLQAAFPRS